MSRAGGVSYEENNWYEPYTYQTRELSRLGGCDVAMIGDSLTVHGMWNEFWHDLSVANRGIGSDISEGLLARLDTVTALSPGKVFVMIGTNDVARGLAEEETVGNMEAIVEGLSDALPESEIYLQSVLPRTSRYAEEIQSLNASLKSMVERLADGGVDVAWVDLYLLYVDADGDPDSDLFASDGYHMSGKGYRTWRNAIEPFEYE